MKIKQFFDSHPVFRYEEFAEYMQQQGIKRPASWRQQLNYHHKVGNLIHIRRFLYAVKPTPINENDFWIDPYLVAGKATTNAILSYHTALELHGLAYTTFQELTFFSSKSVKTFAFQAQQFRSITIPKSLVRQNRLEFEEIIRQGISIKVTGLERTIVDILDRPDLGGGWEEVWRSLDHLVHFDPKKLVDYALLLNNATTIAKVGFFLEQLPPHLAIDPSYIEKLLLHRPKQPHYMERDQRGEGKYYEKWRLIVPLQIVERKWEEPNVGDV